MTQQLIRPAAIYLAEGMQFGSPDSVFFSNATLSGGQKPFAAMRSPRAFLGDGMLFSGATAGNNAVTIPQLTDNTVFDGTHDLEYFANNATLVSATDYGIAGAFAATSKNSTLSDQTIAVAVHAANHDAGGRGWGIYLDVVRMSGAGTTWGGEFQIVNKGPSPTAGDGAPGTTPKGRFVTGATRALTLGSGADPTVHATAYPIDVALYIAPNGSTFWNGITFGPDSLEAWADGKRRAMNMESNGTRISWWSAGASAGNPYEQFSIEANVTGAAENRQSMIANDNGITFNNDAGHPYFFINNGPDTQEVNFISIASAETGDPARIYAGGIDTNSDILLQPAGTGVMRFGTHTTIGAETLSGYITIKDAGGTTRKIGVIS